MPVYAILIQSEEGVELLPKCFSTYNNALNAVKKKYNGIPKADGTPVENWDDRFEEDGTVNIYSNNKVEVEEGHKERRESKEKNDPNLTELYIERGIHISIRRLVKETTRASRAAAAAAAGGGYSRRRHSKRNTKNSRKHRV